MGQEAMTDAKPNQNSRRASTAILAWTHRIDRIAFDRTELAYYSRTMTTPSNHTLRRQPQYAKHANCRARHPARPTVIPPPIAARPERRCQTRRQQDSTECDMIRRDATKIRARAHAREATASRFLTAVIPAKAGIYCAPADWTYRLELPSLGSRHVDKSNGRPAAVLFYYS